MANIKANADGDISSFEKFPEGLHTVMIDKFEFNKDKDNPGQSSALSARIEFIHLEEQSMRISQFVNFDRPALLVKFITTLVKFGVAQKIAQQVPQYFSQDPITVGWDDDYILEKGLDKKPVKLKDQFLFVLRQAINGAIGKIFVENDKDGNARVKTVFSVNEVPQIKGKTIQTYPSSSVSSVQATPTVSPVYPVMPPQQPVIMPSQQPVMWK